MHGSNLFEKQVTAAPPLIREYQHRAVNELTARLDSRPILVAPTGSGKTVILAELCRRMQPRLLWIAHRIELIQQAVKHLKNVGVRGKVTSVQKQARRPIPDVDLIIVDECHHCTETGQYSKLFESNIPIIGTTATPFRLDGRGLGGMFGSLVIASSPRELVDQGYLQEPEIYSHSAPDLQGAKKSMGDFQIKDLFIRASKPKLIADIVSTWKQYAGGKKTLVFAINIEHSQAIVADFTASGVRCEHVDASTPKARRESIWALLEGGQIEVVSNVGIATEGFDLPELDCAIMARPTMSLCLYLQMMGRIMRPQGKAIVLDHAGNAIRHGSPLREIEYTLDAAKKQAGNPLGLKMCKACYLMVPVGSVVCPGCGADMSPVARARQKIQDGELVQFFDKEAVWSQLIDEDPKTAYKRYKEIFGRYPIIIDGSLIEPTHDNKRKIYKYFLEMGFRKQYDKGWASHRYHAVYGCWPTNFVKSVRMEIFNERWQNRKDKS